MENKLEISNHQRRNEETGRKLEDNVRRILNAVLNKKDIEAFSVADVARWAKEDDAHKRLFEYIKVPVKNSCRQEQIMTLPDTDILVVYKQQADGSVTWHPLCIISCKASFHARETETLFWAALMQSSKIKYVCVTEDADRYGPKQSSELKTCQNGNKTRRLLECFCDKTYIIKKYDKTHNGLLKDITAFYSIFEMIEAQGYRVSTSRVFDDYNSKPHAEYCRNVRPFDDLLIDIMNWKFEKLRG